MKVLVTGGAGYVGSHVLRELLAGGHEPVVFDNLSEGHEAAVGDCRLVRGDLGDERQVVTALAETEAEAVMHFAASAYVGESVQNPEKYYFNNVVNTLKLLRAMRRKGVKKLVFSSSCTIYGVPEKVPITEDQPIRATPTERRHVLRRESRAVDVAPEADHRPGVQHTVDSGF